MAHVHFDLQYHVVFSTKKRYPYLTPEKISLIQSIAAELGAMLRFEVIALDGFVDHLHLLLRIPPHLSVATVVKRVKGRTSHEIGDLYWQVGYWVAVVESRNLPLITEYIRKQWQSHANRQLENSAFYEPFLDLPNGPSSLSP